MTITITPRFGLTEWNDNEDVFRREQIADAFAAIESLAAQAATGAYADMPAPGIGNRFYFAEDFQGGVMFFDTGGAWVEVLAKVDYEYTAGTRPIPGRDGRYIYEIDVDRLFRDNGAKYVELITSTLMPSGILMPTLSPLVQPGWLLCDGSSYGTATYPDLFAKIGYRFGGSGGVFKVPNLQGFYLVGANGSANVGLQAVVEAAAGSDTVANAIAVNWLVKTTD